MKTIEVQHWNAEYKGAESKLIKTEEWEDSEESFIKFYELNNSLRYCNGCHYLFTDKKVNERYREFYKKHNTISNYYGNGIVD